ncbi:CvpA family protein [Sporolactobacillus sp. CPB3-1]|uniref:CvpA family protein n=1 Tax=Sporolactobacillus mangiferae TaxID=2940498 RepID=A0ABT0M8A4_9BACL|nr:CvpA family protein [Sporolactobacillus mangiferae]MCL1630580.1 CvpA family protein [Sporolactobacillus mangiferae]
MLLTIVLLIILASGFFNGFRRGLILQLIHLAGFVIAYVVAMMYSKPLAGTLKFWIPFPTSASESSVFQFLGTMDLQSAYYQAIAFIILFLATKIILNIIGSTLNFLAELPILRSVNHLGGALIGFIEIYLILFFLLYAGSLTPVSGIQSAIAQSSLAKSMIAHTPYFSDLLKGMWVAFAGWIR